MGVCDHLEPHKVFSYFEEITRIPHGSRNTQAISDYLMEFARAHGLEAYQDVMGNVIMIAPASAGYEDAAPVILQGHMDMVCEKEPGCAIDFAKDSLDLVVEGNFLTARGTTLGADDGIAVAFALAILDSPEIVHPRLEVVITVDEEIGMLGADAIDVGMLRGRYMLNIDSTAEGEFLTSCAGGMSLIGSLPLRRETVHGVGVSIRISGLLGGHSGEEIDKERANADILMGRVLNEIAKQTPFGIISMAGGTKDNAIPRECVAELVIPNHCSEQTVSSDQLLDLNILREEISHEYAASDPGIQIEVTLTGETDASVTDMISTEKVIFLLRSLPNGVQHYSMELPGLVETSLNLGILQMTEEELSVTISIRSSVSSRKTDLADRVCRILAWLGAEAEACGDYPAWEYVPQSVLRETITRIYREHFGKEPSYTAIHAGLECGIFSEKLPGLDCVSFGPDMYDIHTTGERLSISSVQRVWEFLEQLLAEKLPL